MAGEGPQGPRAAHATIQVHALIGLGLIYIVAEIADKIRHHLIGPVLDEVVIEMTRDSSCPYTDAPQANFVSIHTVGSLAGYVKRFAGSGRAHIAVTTKALGVTDMHACNCLQTHTQRIRVASSRGHRPDVLAIDLAMPL